MNEGLLANAQYNENSDFMYYYQKQIENKVGESYTSYAQGV